MTNISNQPTFFQGLGTKFQIVPNLLSANVSGTTIILDAKKGEYYELNEVGTFIWEQLKSNKKTIEELKELVLNEFEVEESIVFSDLNNILNEFVKEKFVEIS